MQTVQDQAKRLSALEKRHDVDPLGTTQSEIDNLVINESKKPVIDNQANIENKTNLVFINGLSQNQLAERLNCGVRRLIDRRSDAVKLAEYTSGKDPDGITWEYRDRKYYPVKSLLKTANRDNTEIST